MSSQPAIQGSPSVVSKTPLPKYEYPPETGKQLNYADLVSLDLSEFDLPGGKQRLAEQLKESVHKVGFFYVTNIGLSQDQIDQQFAIAKAFFALPEEERLKYRAPLEEGSYNGYRPLGAVDIRPGVKDTLEFYSIFKCIPETERTQPEIIREYWTEIERFSRHVHEHISFKLLQLLAIMLELPEDHFLESHRYEDLCDSSIRYMYYHARSKKQNEVCRDIYFNGHTDNGSMTFMFQQPISALQVQRSPESDWEYLYVPAGTLAVNLANAFNFLSNGYMQSGFHRVIAPPEDQAHNDRLALLYFLRPTEKLILRTLDTPFLQREGYGKTTTENDLEISWHENWRDNVRSRGLRNYNK
ncbi:hypothetical protein N7517_007804 [Penicillium concentricum]|uniref:Fe2OG dioxygenase domain-containing protein n=1 Tax=Penicillium concentricum TaxID=293559 RepID=A0A9W9SBX2_9EURO|nr:uncharacterized protein N7517_007804 [Penicillium concentricum]KAJ5375798.1 hypothetical protein N7517_007804 [Penicillium concentricum]